MFRSKILIGSLVAITSLSAFVLMSTTASADDEPYSETYTKSALIRVQSACTLSGAEATPHTKTINPGTYESNIGETVFSAVCNDAGGFAVYAIGYTDNTDGNNKLVHSTDSNTYINTGLAESGNDSAWAMKLTAVENDATPTIHGGYDSYSLVPDDYVKVASYPSTTTASASSMFKSYYAAYISLTQPAGIYNGQVKYVLVHPSNGEAPEKDDDDDDGEDPLDPDPDITKSTNHPCMDLGDGTTCDDTDDDGIGDTLVFPANSLLRAYEIAYTNAGKPMYIEDTNAAIGWRPMVASDYATVGGKEVRFAIQDISMTFDDGSTTKNVCEWARASVVNGPGSQAYIDEAPVLDIRDGKTYWIAKLADGRCWMTQNLDLNLTASGLSSKTSDLTYFGDKGYDAAHGYARNSETNEITWTPTNTTIPPSSISNDGYTVTGYIDSNTAPTSVDVGNWYWIGSWYTSATNNYLNIAGGGAGEKFGQSKFNTNGDHGHVGNYYNWSAAVASNDTSSFSSSTYSDASANPKNSICPAGWRLPIITSYTTGQMGNNEFYNLIYKYSMGASTDYFSVATPLWFVRGGYLAAGGLSSSGYSGNYWSSTVNLGYSSYHLTFESQYSSSADAQHRSDTLSIRCIAR